MHYWPYLEFSGFPNLINWQNSLLTKTKSFLQKHCQIVRHISLVKWHFIFAIFSVFRRFFMWCISVWRPAKWWMFYGCPLAPAPLIWQKSKHQLTLSFLPLCLKTKCLRWMPRISGERPLQSHHMIFQYQVACSQNQAKIKAIEQVGTNVCQNIRPSLKVSFQISCKHHFSLNISLIQANTV